MKNIIEHLRNQPPELKNPEQLTDDILDAINNVRANPAQTRISQRNKRIVSFQRIFAAAAVFLILIFGAEQYLVLDKILKLEKQAAMLSSQNSHPVGLKMLINSRTVPEFNTKEISILRDILNQRAGVLKPKEILSLLDSYDLSLFQKRKLVQLMSANGLSPFMKKNIINPEKN